MSVLISFSGYFGRVALHIGWSLISPSNKNYAVLSQALMTESRSPIVDFYPTEFRVDQEGKRNEWEGVVLVPFIDEARLLLVRSCCYLAVLPYTVTHQS